MEFRVLGPVQVHADGDPIDVGGSKVGALVAALLAHRGASVSQDRLAEAIWPDSPKPRDALQSYVSRLRRVLGAGGRDQLRRDPSGYSLDIAGRLDADRFEKLVEEGTAALAGDDARTGRERLHAALGLWRGDAFGEYASDELVRPEAARLEELRLTARERRVEADLALGRHQQAIGELEGLCQSHPLRERLWELRMLALVRSGRQAEALRAYQRARGLLAELGIEPSEPLRRMEQMILAQDPDLELPPGFVAGQRVAPATALGSATSGVDATPVMLPADVTRFIGRTEEVDQLVRLLEGTRLLTLSGMGGVGKTRLAIQLARRATTAHPGGVTMVDVSPIVDPSEIEQDLADRLREIGDPTERPVLVIFDNCEHLIDACAAIIGRTLATRPNLRVVATSREPLKLPGETRWRVEPLAPPDEDAGSAEVAGNDAARLFVERARAIRPDIELDDVAMSTIGAICRRLDGIPLAIELAAALVGTTTLGRIEKGLVDRFDLLREGYRTSPARQQTLAGAFDWSYDLLEDGEKRLLEQLRPVYVGFPRRVAEVMCADRPAQEPEVGAHLNRLVDRSFVQVDRRAEDVSFRILPTIRQFIWERTGWQGVFEARGFVVSLGVHTEPRLRGTPAELWSALLDGPSDVARATLDLTYHLHDLEAGSFLAGVVAARTTSTGRVAFLGGVRSRYITRFESGFRAGTSHVGGGADVECLHVSEAPDYSGFMDVGRARATTTQAFERGVDVVFHGAGFLGGQGVLEAARDWHGSTGERRWVIGVDADEALTREASVRPFVLTSMRRQIPIGVYRHIKAAVAAGAPEQAPALDLANEGVGLSRTGGAIDELVSGLEEVRAAIIAGEIEVPRLEPSDNPWATPPAQG